MPPNNNSPTLVTYDCLHYAILDDILPSDFEYTFDTYSKTAQRDMYDNYVESHLALPGPCPNCEELGYSGPNFKRRALAEITELQNAARFSWQRFLECGRETHLASLSRRARHFKKNPNFCKIFATADPREDPIFNPWKLVITNLTEAKHLLTAAAAAGKKIDAKRIACLINSSRWNTTRIHLLLTDIIDGMWELANEELKVKRPCRKVHYHRDFVTGEKIVCSEQRDRENRDLLIAAIENRKAFEWEERMLGFWDRFIREEEKRVREELGTLSNVTGIEAQMGMLSIR